MIKADKDKKIVFLFIFCFSVCVPFFVLAQEVKYNFSKIDRDPFIPLVSKSGVILIVRKIDIDGLSIKGIVYSKDSSVAIINDEVVEKGDKIGEYFVSKIEEKRVILEKDNKEFILKLEEEE